MSKKTKRECPKKVRKKIKERPKNLKKKMGENKQIRSPQFDPNAKWDAYLDLGIRRFVYSSLAGAVGGFLLFTLHFGLILQMGAMEGDATPEYGSPVTRWASVALGAGVGIGSAYTECSYKFDEKLTTSKISDTHASQCANSLWLGFARADNNVGARKNNVTAKQQH